MPLRNFQPSHAEYVSTYAPLPLDAIQHGAQQHQRAWEMGQEELSRFEATHQTMKQSLYGPNKQAGEQILAKDREMIERMSDPDGGVAYQDMIPLLRRRARQTMSELEPYLEDSAQIRSFIESIENRHSKNDILNTSRNYALAQVQAYEGLQIDPETGARTGFRPPNIPTAVDIDGQIQDLMKFVSDRNEAGLLQAGASPGFVSQILQKGRSRQDMEEIQAMLQSLLLSRPENAEFLEHQAEIERYNRSRVPDENLEEMHRLYVQRAQQQGDENIPDFEEFADTYRNYSSIDAAASYINPYLIGAGTTQDVQSFRNQPGEGTGTGRAGTNMLTSSISTSTLPTGVSTPADFRQRIAEIDTDFQNSITQVPALLMEKHGIVATVDEETGEISVESKYAEDGTDMSPLIADYQSEINHILRTKAALEAEEADMRAQAEKRTGYSFDDIDIEAEERKLLSGFQKYLDSADHIDDWIKKAASPLFEKAREQSNPFAAIGLGLSSLVAGTAAGVAGIGKAGVDLNNALVRDFLTGFWDHWRHDVHPLYAEYMNIMNDASAQVQRHVPVMSLGSAGNAYMESLLVRQVTPFRDGLTGEIVEPSDYNLNEGRFSGIYKDEGGLWMAAYMFYDPDASDDSKRHRQVVLPAPPNIDKYLVENGYMDEVEARVLSVVGQLSSTPGGQRETQLPIYIDDDEPYGEARIEVTILPRNQQDVHRNHYFRVVAVGPTGNRVGSEVGDMNKIADAYKTLIHKILKAQE